MICQNCGTVNRDDARFCSQCGVSLLPAEGEPMEPPQADLPQAEDEEAGPDRPAAPGPPAPGPPEPPREDAPPTPPPPGVTGPVGSAPGPQVPEPEGPPAGTVTVPPPPAGAPGGRGGPEPPPGPGLALGRGWGRAILLAAVVFAAMVALGMGLAFFSTPNGSVENIAKLGGLLFYLFHHVGIRITVPQFAPPTDSPFGGAIDVHVTAAAAFLLATALAVLLLYLSGRSVARRAGGPPAARLVHGAKVALPYAALTLAASFAVRVTLPVPANPVFRNGGAVEVGPNPLPAFLWPFALALLAGLAGGAAAARPALERNEWGRRILAAVGGGWRMLWVALALAYVGLLVTVAINRDAPAAFPFTVDYFRLVARSGALDGARFVTFHTVLPLPNWAALVLVPAMGSSLGASGAGSTTTLLSYTHWPQHVDLQALAQLGRQAGGVPTPGVANVPIDFGTAPLPYFLFLLVPLVATILGGLAAARRARPVGRGGGAAIGASAGVVFGLLVLLVALLASIGVRVEVGLLGFEQDQAGVFGAELLSAGLLAVAWGVLGGVIGGLLGSSGERPALPAGPTGFEQELHRLAEGPPAEDTGPPTEPDEDVFPQAPDEPPREDEPPSQEPKGGRKPKGTTGFEGLGGE